MTQATGRTLHITLWVIQILLALLFLLGGGSKLVMPAAVMAKQSPLPVGFLRFIGVCELLGAIGLIVPGATHIKPVLTPLAATGLMIITIGATVVTVQSMGVLPAIFPLVTAGLSAFVAYGRWRVAPLS
jgi:hypothetical protein